MNDLPTGNFPDYNHNKYGDKPGQLWSADEQCRILLRDKAAVAYFATNADIAVNIRKINFLMQKELNLFVIYFLNRSHVIR
jgi:hypothetical protein